MSIRRTLLTAVVSSMAIVSGSALAQEKVMTERTLTNPTGWWMYYNVTPQKLSDLVNQHKARIVDLDVNSVSPLRLSATLVANSGVHASGWWWYYGLTAQQVSGKLKEHNARLIDLDAYPFRGSLRFAVVMKPNKGSAATGWWWWYGQTPQQLGERAKSLKARIVDLERYRIGGQTRYAAIMVSNQGSKATGWWWYYGQTAGQVSERIKQHKARILDIERYRTGSGIRHDIVLVPNTGSHAVGWWWYRGISAQQLLEMARRHGARLIDIETPRDGANAYTGLMVDNGMTSNGDCGGKMASFDRKIVQWMKKYAIPGASAAVIKNNRLVYVCAFGYADLKTGKTVKPTDRFRLASISKPITVSALRQLKADGKLDFSDKMLDRLGSAKPDSPYKDDRLDDITIQNLIDHKGGWNIGKLGFDPMFYSDQVASALGTSRPSSCRNIIRYMFQNIKLSFAPGGGIDKKDYSNFGYCILGRVIEAASGTSYENYVKDKVFSPIKITAARLGRSLASKRFPNEVQYYDKPFAKDVNSVFPSGPQKVQFPDGGFHVEAMDAHGGWIATAIDTARFAAMAKQAPYGGGNWAFEGGMGGTRTRVERSGDVAVAILFNTAPVEDLDKLIDQSVAGVAQWPSGNLFGKYGY